jgi:hypothetical protein
MVLVPDLRFFTAIIASRSWRWRARHRTRLPSGGFWLGLWAALSRLPLIEGFFDRFVKGGHPKMLLLRRVWCLALLAKSQNGTLGS